MDQSTTLPDADTLLAGPLGDWLRVNSGSRAQARGKVASRQTWGIVAAGVIAVAMILSNSTLPHALLAAAVAGALFFFWAEQTRRAAAGTIKTGINREIARSLGLDFSPTITDLSLFETACTFDLLPTHDERRFEDQWSGMLAGQPFTVHEARLVQVRGSGKERRKTEVFAGALMSIGFGRAFSGTTLVTRKGFGAKLGAMLGLRTKSVGGFELGRVNLVDPRFGDSFDVWSTDQTEAHYLANPSWVERLVAVERAFSGDRSAPCSPAAGSCWFSKPATCSKAARSTRPTTIDWSSRPSASSAASLISPPASTNARAS